MAPEPAKVLIARPPPCDDYRHDDDGDGDHHPILERDAIKVVLSGEPLSHPHAPSAGCQSRKWRQPAVGELHMCRARAAAARGDGALDPDAEVIAWCRRKGNGTRQNSF